MPVPEMDDLKARLAGYGQFVQGMIEKSRQALVNRQAGLPREIIETDEPKANSTEIELEAECTSLIARHQPMARDLRTILMVMGITNDLERIADHAVNIAEAVSEHINGTSLKPDEGVLKMFDETSSMVDGAIRSFITEDSALGQKVCESDNTIDELASSILEGLSASMTALPATVPQNLALLKIAGNLERIADLSTNIGEDVIYMTEGRVIKHHLGAGG